MFGGRASIVPVYSSLDPTLSSRSATIDAAHRCPGATSRTSIHPNLFTSGSTAETRQHLNQDQSGALLHLGFLGVQHIRAGVGSHPEPVTATERVCMVHLQTFPLLILFRLRLGELGFYLDRVYVGVEVAHEGKDDADHHQQRGKQDVLSPLVNKNTHAVRLVDKFALQQTLHGLLTTLTKAFPFIEDAPANRIHPPVPRA